VPLVFAAIAPHGGLAVEEWCDPADRDVARLTRSDLSLERHAEAGRALAAAAAASDRRIAFVASADHGHAHDPDGPYGCDPASAEFDAAIVDAVRGNQLERILDLEDDFIERAKADSPWQLALLQGMVGGVAAGELLSYEAPTYFGMLCASYELAKR
jgi:aromatic ring-opening dioxygenase LigB subunit